VEFQKAGGTDKSVRVLVVDDFEPFRRFVCATLEQSPNLQIVGEVTDGLEAVHRAEELQPDLILMDIGLPSLNGIEAARRIRELSPESKILFVSENRSGEVAEEALRTGAGGYVVKSDASAELLPATKAVLAGKRFISASLAGHFLVAAAVSTTQTTLLTSMVMLISGIR
jgi:DNA-binding NarL/FixJ family response regulator